VNVIEQTDNKADVITPALISCHSAIIGEYVLEGHVKRQPGYLV